jgi:hypothetical protein
MSPFHTRSPISGAAIAVLVGVIGGLIVLALAASDSPFAARFGGPQIDRSGRLSIQLNGVSQRMARDIFLPTEGWVMQLQFTDLSVAQDLDGLIVILRSERTGATIEIQDRFHLQDGVATPEIGTTGQTGAIQLDTTAPSQFASLTVSRDLGLAAGLLSVRALFTDSSGIVFEDSRRIRIRSPLGLPPISVRQVIHFDFEVDHDDDGLPDFWKDLELFGLASDGHSKLARIIAAQIESRALRRVEAAYSANHDPNRTGRAKDPVRVRFRPTEDPSALVSHICVGGSDPTQSDLVGHVRLDLRNKDKTSRECAREPAAGLFPAELETYRDSALYGEAFGPLLTGSGSQAVGRHPDDSVENLDDLQARRDGGEELSSRQTRVLHAITIFADALGSIMAHEAGHALGLVPEGRPSVGLFGGDMGIDYAHNIDAFGESEQSPWLMNAGGNLTFEQLAGLGTAGPLQFRPLNYAYLRDRVIITARR